MTTGHGEGDAATSRRVLRSELDGSAACRALVDAFIEARLLVTDRADDGQAVVGIAHEALLRHWPRVQQWLAEDREFLRIRDRVADQVANWRKEGQRPDLLLPEGKPLSDAREMLARRRADLRPELVEFVEQSSSRASRGRRRRMQAIGGAAGLILALVSGWGGFAWFQNGKLQKQISLTINTVANLSEVPQRLQALDDKHSVLVLAAIDRAVEGTLRQAPDVPETKGARAVNRYLKAEMLRRQEKLDEALREVQEAIDLGTELIKSKLDTTDQTRNEGGLATFYLAKGKILDDLTYQKSDDRYKRDALAAYEQCRQYAELAPNDPQSQTAILASYFRSVQLHKEKIEGSPDTPESRRELQETLAMAKKAWDLARERANREPNDQARSDVAKCDEILRQVQGLQQGSGSDKG